MIRTINDVDKAYLKKIIDSEFDTNYTSDSPFTNWLIYELNDKIVGFINYSVMYDKAEIDYIFVDLNYRNKGIGTELLNEMFKKLKETSVSCITLEVKCTNKEAISLYEKSGFKKVSVRKNYYKGIDAFLMLKSW